MVQISRVSSSVIEFGLNDLLPLFFCLLVDHFLIHHRDHLIWFMVGRQPPIFISTISPLLDRLSLTRLFFLVLFDADIPVNPINLIFFTFKSISALFVGISLCTQWFLISGAILFEISQLFFILTVLWL